jgi:hypothetical protein
VQVNSVQSRYYFPDLPNLRDVKTYCISAYNSNILQRDINAVPCVNQTDFSNSFITLYANNREVFQRLDMQYFLTLVNYGAWPNNFASFTGSLALDYLKIDYSKSFIEFASGYAPTTVAPYVFPFGIYYIK